MGNDKRKERRRRRKGKKEGIMERLRIGWPDLHIWGRIGNTVYKLIHSTTGELYALKIIKNHSMSIPVPTSLDHPNVVKIHDIVKEDEDDDDGGQIQVLMEYMDGGSLEGFHTLHEIALAQIAYQILSGLSHLHSKNLFHAAIKPSNILVASPMQVKMADLGLSIACTSPATTATYAADIWSLGVCLVQFYLGTSPFDDHDLPKLPPTASHEFKDFMAHCLDRDPANRWTADQLLHHNFIHFHTIATFKLCAQPSSPKQNQIFQIALQLYAEDCPDRWPKVAAIITDRKTANDILRHSKVYAQSYFEPSILNKDKSTPKSRSSRVIKAHPLGVSVQEYHHQEQISETPTFGRNEGDKTKCYIKDVQVQNLPDCLRRCVVYCFMFSNNYEFEMDKLVRLWIAVGLIKPQKTLELDDIGRFYFDILVCKEFISRSTYDHLRSQFKYKVNQSMVPSFQIIAGLLPGDFQKVDEIVSGDTSNSVTHLSLICEDVGAATYKIIGDYHCLQTLMVVHSIESPKLQIPNQLFLNLKLLRVLDLSRSHLSELPGSIEYLISLQYLDLSETHITELPYQVEVLQELQTLNLYDCNRVNSLPNGMQKLVNLRHLDLDIQKLWSMPPGMGNLTSLQTLRGFIVSEEDGCGITELKNLNKLRGSLRIMGLQNVSNSAEAREAYLSNKHDVNSLELQWSYTTRIHDGECVEILKYLRPPSHIKELTLVSYSGSVLPSWISDPTFVDIVSITLNNCVNCNLLPSFGELPSLKFLKLYHMIEVRDINRLFCRNQDSGEYHAFPKLEKLTLDDMYNLEEWTGVESGDFPCLHALSLQNCSKIVALPCISHLNSLKHLQIVHCKTLQSFTEERLPLPASLEFLHLSSCKKIVALPSLSHLKSLRDLELIYCLNLQSFPVEGLPVSLQALTVIGCPRIQQCEIAKVNCIWD